MTTIVQFRMDIKEKSLLEGTLRAMGLDCSSAFRMFARHTIREGKIPFEVTAGAKANIVPKEIKKPSETKKHPLNPLSKKESPKTKKAEVVKASQTKTKTI